MTSTARRTIAALALAALAGLAVLVGTAPDPAPASTDAGKAWTSVRTIGA